MTASNPRAQQHTGIRGLHHVGLSVTDLAAARAFYQGVMPLQTVSEPFALTQEGRPPGAAPLASATLLRGPNAYLALQQLLRTAQVHAAQPRLVSGLAHINLSVLQNLHVL
jgi:catechol 2,3-dioxygenase-like lactoylglutathione lyase family enzyme